MIYRPTLLLLALFCILLTACGSDAVADTDKTTETSASKMDEPVGQKSSTHQDGSKLIADKPVAKNETTTATDNADVKREITPVKVEDISEIIKNPQTAQEKPKTPKKSAKMSFDESVYDFGFVMEGDTVYHEFSFTNTGKAPLLITDARSTCGCTVPEWPKEPIAPGETSMISARFDTKNKIGRQTKEVTIYANTLPTANKVKLIGIVDTPR